MEQSEDSERWSQLMCQSQQGDKIAYSTLLDELSTVISQSLRRKFGNFPFIDDCVQESLLAIHLARHTYQPHRPFRPWMNALVQHKTIDYLRKQNKHRAEVTVNFEEEINHLVIDGERLNIDELILSSQLLTNLDKPNRDALIYTKLIGLSVADTAAVLNISSAAVKQRVRRAIRKTRKLLNDSITHSERSRND